MVYSDVGRSNHSIFKVEVLTGLSNYFKSFFDCDFFYTSYSEHNIIPTFKDKKTHITIISDDKKRLINSYNTFNLTFQSNGLISVVKHRYRGTDPNTKPSC